MTTGRITIFNSQDAILAETQSTITTAMAGMAEAMRDLPPEIQPHILAVMAQLSCCTEVIGELREATTQLNNAAVRVDRFSGLQGLDEADLGRLRVEAHKAGHHGSLAEFASKRSTA